MDREKQAWNRLNNIGGGRCIRLMPGYRKLTGSLTGTVLLSQIMYWASVKKRSGEKVRFWKTDAEIQEETGLTENELRAAKKTIKQLPFITISLAGIPPTTWYEIDLVLWDDMMWQDLSREIHEIKPMAQCTHLPILVESTKLNSLNSRKHNTKVTEITRPEITKIKTPSDGSEGDNNGFGLATPEDTNTTEFDREMAAMLKKAVDTIPARRTGATQCKPSAWAGCMRLLRTQDGFKEKEIRRAMMWYAAHIGQEFVPEAFSGTSFRNKFHTILNRAERDLFVVVVEPKAQEVVERLNAESWPPACRAQLPAAVQTCLSAYKNWITARNKYVEYLGNGAPKEEARLLGFGRHLQDAMPPPSPFVQAWMETVKKRVLHWNDWDGNLQPFLFQPGSEKFQKMGRAWADAYCARATAWDMLFAKITVEGNE